MDLGNKLKELQSKKSHSIVFVSGLGGSGKTFLAKKLVEENPNARHFELDWYLVLPSSERGEKIQKALNSSNQKEIDREANPINWYDYDAFKKDLRNFQKTGKFNIENAWDQKTGEKVGIHSLDFGNKNGLIICDGDYLLHSEVASLADLVVLLDLSPEEARRRAEERDRHRSNPEHLARKRFIAQNYDLSYFQKNRPNAEIIVSI